MLPFNSNGTMKKICASCLEVVPVSEFYRNLSVKDGLYAICKKCHIKTVKKWNGKNPEKVQKNKKGWEMVNSKRRSQFAKKWKKEHPDRKREIEKKWHTTHPEYRKNWQRNNKDKLRNYEQTRRARIAGNGGNLTVEEWNAILDFYGHKCLCCGRNDVKLTIDHVIPIIHGGTHTADNVQPLCRSCNSRKSSKHIDYRKENFHETPRD